MPRRSDTWRIDMNCAFSSPTAKLLFLLMSVLACDKFQCHVTVAAPYNSMWVGTYVDANSFGEAHVRPEWPTGRGMMNRER